ncbi:MAG TPA: hypothetical protein VEF04_14700, partial [Blastocatellia bacterium]|nr:hypothetical protein [Blastocatellia bacterium]
HFLIATVWMTVYALASTKLSVLTHQAIVCGIIYGVVVYLFMYNVVLPLSAYHSKPFNQTPKAMLISVMIHMFCVGLPIALVTKLFTANTSEAEMIAQTS